MTVTRTLSLVLIALFAVSLAACDRVSQSALDLVVGDCFVEPAAEAEVQDVQRAPCNESHSGEVMLVADYPNQDTYPGEDAFQAWIEANCLGETFTTYTGKTYEDALDISVSYLYPTTEGWEQGDKEITCYLVPVDGTPVNFSYRLGASPAAS
jgi:Septum formation